MGELFIAEEVYRAIREAQARDEADGIPSYRLGVARSRAFRSLQELWGEYEAGELVEIDHAPWFHAKHR